MTSPTIIDAARRYAAADRSDPFTLARCLTHARNGIASMSRRASSQEYGLEAGDKSYYDADRYMEERKISAGARTLTAILPAYRNVVRP